MAVMSIKLGGLHLNGCQALKTGLLMTIIRPLLSYQTTKNPLKIGGHISKHLDLGNDDYVQLNVRSVIF